MIPLILIFGLAAVLFLEMVLGLSLDWLAGTLLGYVLAFALAHLQQTLLRRRAQKLQRQRMPLAPDPESVSLN